MLITGCFSEAITGMALTCRIFGQVVSLVGISVLYCCQTAMTVVSILTWRDFLMVAKIVDRFSMVGLPEAESMR